MEEKTNIPKHNTSQKIKYNIIHDGPEKKYNFLKFLGTQASTQKPARPRAIQIPTVRTSPPGRTKLRTPKK